MPDHKQIVAFKIGARARKLAKEECIVEGYELLMTALAEAQRDGDAEMEAYLRRELQRFEAHALNGGAR
jgi:predicted transcriptional regulator